MIWHNAINEYVVIALPRFQPAACNGAVGVACSGRQMGVNGRGSSVLLPPAFPLKKVLPASSYYYVLIVSFLSTFYWALVGHPGVIGLRLTQLKVGTSTSSVWGASTIYMNDDWFLQGRMVQAAPSLPGGRANMCRM